jgi:hypothetical protein
MGFASFAIFHSPPAPAPDHSIIYAINQRKPLAWGLKNGCTCANGAHDFDRYNCFHQHATD